MKIYYDNKADDATITSDEAQANYPAANMQNSILPKVFKGAEYTELEIDAGGGLKNISSAYTNLVTDPTDMSTANWTKTAVTVTDSGETIKGETLWKVEATASSANIVESSDISITASEDVVYSFIARKGNETNGAVDLTASGNDDQVSINFSTQNVVVSVSTLLKAEWYDDNTVEVFVKSATLVTNASYNLRFFGSISSTSGNYTLYTEPQVVKTANMYPFVDGAHSADIINETFTMPDRFTVDMIITPFFAYDTGSIKYIYNFYVSSGIKQQLVYDGALNKINLAWDDPTFRNMLSQEFDDGSALTNINQRLRIIASIDTVSGGINDSRFIVIPLESGSLFEDTSWNGTPDAKSSTFSTLSIGHNGVGANQADSEYEYLHIYEGLLVGTVADSDDVTELLKDKELLLDKTYQSKITATDLLLANTTIHDGDTILLRANNVDSFNAGSPVDETVVWDEDIIHHNFTSGTYQYWWLSVNSSNDVEIGRLYLGESSTPPDIAPTVSVVNNTADVKTKSIGGQTYGDERYNYKQFITTFSSVTHAQKAALETFFDSITTIKPYFIEFDETELDLTRYYVTTDQTELRFTLLVNSDYYTASVNFVEEK